MLAIAVISYDRPKYLTIFLHGLSLVKGIQEHPIFIYFDLCPKEKKRNIQIVDRFSQGLNITSIFRPKQYRILSNITSAYKETFNRGFDEVLMFESDVVVRSDVLQYLESIPRDAYFYNLMGKEEIIVPVYRAFGNLLEREKFDTLYNWVMQKKYIGRPNVRGTQIMQNAWAHDAVFARFLVDHDLKTRFPPMYYVAHIGLEGIHRKARTGEEKAVLERMFRGSSENWLWQAIEIIEQELYPKSLATTMKPRGYIYG